MGYELTLKVPEVKLTQEFIPSRKNGQFLKREIKQRKLELLIYCLQKHEGYMEISSTISFIRTQVEFLCSLMQDLAKLNLYDQCKNDEEITFSGLAYSRPVDLELYIDYAIEDLAIATLTKYNNDINEDYDKLNSIKEVLDLEECVTDYVESKFISAYKDEFEQKDE